MSDTARDWYFDIQLLGPKPRKPPQPQDKDKPHGPNPLDATARELAELYAQGQYGFYDRESAVRAGEPYIRAFLAGWNACEQQPDVIKNRAEMFWSNRYFNTAEVNNVIHFILTGETDG